MLSINYKTVAYYQEYCLLQFYLKNPQYILSISYKTTAYYLLYCLILKIIAWYTSSTRQDFAANCLIYCPILRQKYQKHLTTTIQNISISSSFKLPSLFMSTSSILSIVVFLNSCLFRIPTSIQEAVLYKIYAFIKGFFQPIQ